MSENVIDSDRADIGPATLQDLANIPRGNTRKVWLTQIQVERMLRIAKSNSLRDYLLMVLMRYGLRVGEIVGERGLPGIHVEDVRKEGIWIKGKGFARGIVQDTMYPLPSWLMDELRRVGGKKGRLFDISERHSERLVKDYARQAGVEDWQRIGPHRLRAFYATNLKEKGYDAFTIRDAMRHKNIVTTNLYVGKTSVERLASINDSL